MTPIQALVVHNGETDNNPRSRDVAELLGHVAPVMLNFFLSPPRVNGLANRTIVLMDDPEWPTPWHRDVGGWKNMPRWAWHFQSHCYLIGSSVALSPKEMLSVAREIRHDFLGQFSPSSGSYTVSDR